MKNLGNQRGFTLLEIIIVIAIVGVLVPGIFLSIGSFLRVLPWEHSELEAMHDLNELTFWVAQDANAAQTFTPGSAPDYGTFSGLELGSGSTIRKNVRYYHQGTYVMREVIMNDALVSLQRVADHIAQYGDVTFQYTPASWVYDQFTLKWTYSESKVAVTAKSTVAADVPRDVVYSANITAELRPQSQRPVVIPGNPPVVPPLPNEIDFYVSGEPTVLAGQYNSGSGADLKYDDVAYYEVKGAGTPLTLAWGVTSESIPYTQISNITIQFIGQADQDNVAYGIYVYNPTDPAHVNAGYDSVPDWDDSYAVKDTDKEALFSLSDADVTYVNSLTTKVIKVKVTASFSKNFKLLADKLIFKVAGTPQAGFYRDFQIDADVSPLLVTGDYQGGTGTDLAADDTLYYTTKSVLVADKQTIVWEAVSQVISFSTISSIDVIWVGQVDQNLAYLEFYVYNLTDHGGNGYAATPDYSMTYPTKSVDVGATFSLNATDVSYIKSLTPKQVLLRVKAWRDPGANAVKLVADRLIFRVKP